MEIINIEITHWTWWVVALLCFVIEITAPGALFLSLGLSALIVGACLFIYPELNWQVQSLIFASLAVLIAFLIRGYIRSIPTTNEKMVLNQRGTGYIGREFVLKYPIINHTGKLRVDDTYWKITGKDCPAGTAIRVHDIVGSELKVEVLGENYANNNQNP